MDREEMAISHERISEKNKHEFVLPLPRHKEATPKLPSGLVVSSDDEVRKTLAESLGECGLESIFSSTVSEGRIAMTGRAVFLVFSEEWLPDGGSYLDIVNWIAGSGTRIPLVVVSRIGDWPEYLRAVASGAFDYVAYPPIRGELRRVIRNALRSRHSNSEVPMSSEIRPGGQKT
jgi:DNA-binding NtrC family response regulator